MARSYLEKIESVKYNLAETGDLDYDDVVMLLEYVDQLETMLNSAWRGNEWQEELAEENN